LREWLFTKSKSENITSYTELLLEFFKHHVELADYLKEYTDGRSEI
jgi:hypothetical protein